jgi:hypothetical protein
MTGQVGGRMSWWQIALLFAGIPSAVGVLISMAVWWATAPPEPPAEEAPTLHGRRARPDGHSPR